ncbi:hypothetical protein DFS34DRAFT_132610 [Phlyctochytrium arcticum]|nr:hypothetical protein DFS34DRAFT_132610 [Phlyctochytrium arcticum]
MLTAIANKLFGEPNAPVPTFSLSNFRHLTFTVLFLSYITYRLNPVEYATDLYKVLGFSPVIPNHGMETCTLINAGPEGCEDIVWHHPTGVAFMACSNVTRRRHWFPPMAKFGEFEGSPDPVWMYNPKTRKSTLMTLDNFTGPLFTHGIKLYADPKDPKMIYLYLVNHLPSGSVIEIFSHQVGGSNSLTHIETVRDPLIKTPNNIAPIGPRTFFVSNDHGFPHAGLLRSIEDFGQMAWANIVLWDQGRARVVKNRVSGPNGLALSPDQSLLYVNNVMRTTVSVYRIHHQSTEPTIFIKLVDSIKLDFLNDNIDVDPRNGDLYVTGHTNGLKFLKHTESPKVASPSRVARIVKKDNKDWDVQRLVEDDGKRFSGGTIAAVDPGTDSLLLSGVYLHGFYHCTGMLRKG